MAQLVGDLIIYKGPRGVLLGGVLDPGDWLAVLVVERDLGDHLPSSPGWCSLDICQGLKRCLACTPCQGLSGIEKINQALPVLLVGPSRVSHVKFRFQLQADVVAMVEVGNVFWEPDPLHVGSPP